MTSGARSGRAIHRRPRQPAVEGLHGSGDAPGVRRLRRDPHASALPESPGLPHGRGLEQFERVRRLGRDGCARSPLRRHRPSRMGKRSTSCGPDRPASWPARIADGRWMAAPSRSGSRSGTMNPLGRPDEPSGRGPTASVAITGTPACIASLMTSPQGSRSSAVVIDGSTRQRARLRRPGDAPAARSRRRPDAGPARLAASSSCSSDPLPTRRNRADGVVDRLEGVEQVGAGPCVPRTARRRAPRPRRCAPAARR